MAGGGQVCPKCLYFEFGDETEEESKNCPKCGSDILLVNASMEAQHLITDIWSDYGGKIASVVAIALAIFDYLMRGNLEGLKEWKNYSRMKNYSRIMIDLGIV